MGEVWLAEAAGAAGFSKRVVIKTLRPELTADPRLVEQFVAEGQLLEQLDHPNIAQILDLGHANDTWFLAMEYVEGFDLRALLRAGPTDGIGEIAALCVLAAAARALEHAGSRRGQDGAPLAIVHHDVTPSNLMVRRDGHVKLVDFGVARSAIRAHLEPGALRGKLPYLAPEQVRAPETVDARADLFALGLVAVELLSGQRAMQVADPAGLEVAWAALAQRVALLCADAHLDTIALVTRLTALDPAQRPASAAAASTQIRTRLAALSVPDIDRPVAQRFKAAFTRLEAEASGFSHTLGALVAAGRSATQPELGTVSLPGLSDLGQPVSGSPSLGEGAPTLASASGRFGALLPPDLATPPLIQDPASAGPVSPAVAAAGANAGTAAAVTVSAGAVSAVTVSATTGGAAAAARPVDPAGGVALRRAAPFGLSKRFWLALVVLLAAAVTVGWWLGGRDQPDSVPDGTPRPSPVVAVAAPVTPERITPGTLPSPTPGARLGTTSSNTVDAGSPGAAAAAPDPAAGSQADASAAPLPVAAAALAAAGTPTKVVAVESVGRSTTRPNRRVVKAVRRVERRRPAQGRLIFRVLPVDAEVRIDGHLTTKRPANGVYRLDLLVGKHKIEVRDPVSGKRQQRVEAVLKGVKRRVGGFTLVRNLP